MLLWYTLPLAALAAGYTFLLLGLAARIRGYAPARDGKELTISVVVPAHNERQRLAPLLAALDGQRYPVHLREYIFVDDRSDDGTGALLADYCRGRPDRTLVTIVPGEAGPSPKKRAISAGVAAAANEIIITTDADGAPSPEWLANTASLFSGNVTMVIGYAPYRTDGPFRTLFHRLLAFDYMAMGTVAAAAAAAGCPATSFGANLAYRKRSFDAIGGFGEAARHLSGDDDLLVHRFQASYPGTVVFNGDPAAAVPNPPPPDFRAFVRQRLRFSSKHTAYPPRLLFWMGLVYCFNLALTAGLGCSLFDVRYAVPAAAALLVKAGADLALLVRGRRFLRERNFIPLYPLAAVPHLLYVVFIPLFARFGSRRW
ncbi:glycosyltransferase [bacterium]|nr:glycosyltransferase [bacterium]